MGFWNGLFKMAQGKPVFDTPGEQEQSRQGAVPAVSAAPAGVDSSGRKFIPEVLFEHCESRLNGSEMEVTVWATNRSAVQIELDKIVMLGMTTQLDRYLGPGEAHQLRLYKGKVPTNSSYHTANLYYKQVDTGDYFCADFTLEYDYDSRGFYKVEEFHPIRPVRDV